ncbi:MAG: hypothetical protein PW843_00955 [Azospirillaceae bacterium]|nr:hypothetical protein [Azospirillaceae bacterium]
MIFTDADARPLVDALNTDITRDGRPDNSGAPLAGTLSAGTRRGVAGRAVLLLALSVGALGLGGCAGQFVPKAIFHDGPEDPEPMANDDSSKALLLGERPVRHVGPAPDAWTNLAAVPERPKNIPDPAARQKDVDSLLADRNTAGQAATQLTVYQNSPDQQGVQRASGSGDSLFGPSAPKDGAKDAGQPAPSKLPVVPSAPPAVPGRVPEATSAIPVATPQVNAHTAGAPAAAAVPAAPATGAASQAGTPAANGTSQTPQN